MIAWTEARSLFVRHAERWAAATRSEEASAIADLAAREIETAALVATDAVHGLGRAILPPGSIATAAYLAAVRARATLALDADENAYTIVEAYLADLRAHPRLAKAADAAFAVQGQLAATGGAEPVRRWIEGFG